MPRNPQGVYTLPAGNPVVPGTLIETTWANPTMSDIAAALTGSLPRDGSAPMTGPLILANSTPSNGREAVSKDYVQSFMVYATGMPVGCVTGFAGNTPPAGFLECNGQAVSRTTYADLFIAIGTIYGTGNGTTTFNIPDMRDQFIRGKSDARAVGSLQAASFASHSHPLSDPGHVHAATQAAHSHAVATVAHNHAVTDPGHHHSVSMANSGFPWGGTGSAVNVVYAAGQTLTTDSPTGISIVSASPIGSADSQQPAVTTLAASTGEIIGAAGGTETVPQNIAQIYVIKALNDAAAISGVISIDTSDANMIAINTANPAIPVLDIKSNIAFGTVKLDNTGKVPVNVMPTGGTTYRGQFSAASGILPVGTFTTGDFWNISVGGTLSLKTSTGAAPASKVVVVGDQIIYDQTFSAWWYNAASAVASIAASAVTVVPTGTIAATNVQSALTELDSEKAPTSAGTATGTSFTPSGTIVATNVQTAIAELDSETQTALADKAPTSAGTAIGTTFTPSGTIGATNVQAAIQELDTEKAPLSSSVPTGAVMDFAMATAPAGWLSCDGALVSRATYAALFAAIGTAWGAGDGSTTFQLPDARGRYRASAGTDGVTASKTFGQKLGDAIRNITGSAGYVYRSAAGSSSGALSTSAFGNTPAKAGIAGTDSGDNATIAFDASASVPTAAENRPYSLVVNTCIKT